MRVIVLSSLSRIRPVAALSNAPSATDVAPHSTTLSLPSNCRQFKADDDPLARFMLTGSALLDAPFSDGGRAGTKPSGFELLYLRPRPFRKASPARREGSQTTMRARLCPISVRIRELSYSSSLDHAILKGPTQGQIILGRRHHQQRL
jgi:hypothetical protein